MCEAHGRATLRGIARTPISAKQGLRLAAWRRKPQELLKPSGVFARVQCTRGAEWYGYVRRLLAEQYREECNHLGQLCIDIGYCTPLPSRLFVCRAKVERAKRDLLSIDPVCSTIKTGQVIRPRSIFSFCPISFGAMICFMT